MKLSEEKTLITHSSQPARLLGYNIHVRRSSEVRPSTRWTRRTLSNHVNLSVPFEDKIQQFIFSKGIAKYKDNSLKPVHRPSLINCTDLEIISIYNAELRGICNYYGIASDFYKLKYFAYLMEYSCLRTLAIKHKCSISKLMKKFKDGKGRWCVPDCVKSIAFSV